MSGERRAGATFALANIGWLDFESRSNTPITSGTYRYATEADAIVLAWAIGAGPVNTVSVTAFDGPLRWDEVPDEIKHHHKNVAAGRAVWASWNAGFDRAIWNYAALNFPEMQPHHIIDVMAQAVASGLPPDLDMAARMSGSTRKVEGGDKLIALFCSAKGLKGVHGTPQTHPAEWRQFVDHYARGDIAAMRSVFLGTRQLPLAEWQEYWAMEAINQRGVNIDLDLVTSAARLAGEDKIRSKAQVQNLTAGAVASVDHVAKMTAWLLPRLPIEGREILTRREEEIDEETGKVTRPAKYALRRGQVERLIAYCSSESAQSAQSAQCANMRDILRLLQIRLYGGSKTPAKFARMLEQHVDGVLMGQYVFNGAAQTGRASSKGVQVHNLARDTLPDELELIGAILDGCGYDTIENIGNDPVARKLSLLIRPAFVPRNDNVFVWSDWSQIEARIVAWLCDYIPGAAARLQIFRDIDADPSLPDLYTRTAAEISGIPIADVTKPIRQRGKVAELALGFCGGVNSLQSMGASYGLHVTSQEARVIVDRWRAANPWAIAYSKELWAAMEAAREMPNHYWPAGRIGFLFKPDYLGGSLLCRLPSGRWLTYRALRPEWVDVLDDDDNVIGRNLEITFARGYGRIKLWPGFFVENFTQAVAADVLRGTLVRLEKREACVRLHTHDEILLEVEQKDARLAAALLKDVMRYGFDWTEGLPLISEETIAYYYTKNERGHGL